MSDERDWRRGDDWGRPYEDDPYWGWRGEGRDWRRESRDLYGDEDYGTRRSWSRGDYGRQPGAREDWRRSQARGDQRRVEAREHRDWPPRRETWRDEGWDQGYRPRDPGHDPAGAARRAIGGSVPGGSWDYEDTWGRGEPAWRRGYQPGGDYGRGYYDRVPYGDRDTYRRPERSWWDRASDEVSSWFGDDDAARRRQRDSRRDDAEAGVFRGHGPRGYTRSDERIREDVSDRLTDNPVLDATEIEVVIHDGEVTLHGHVDSRYSKRLAEDIADEVSGVKHVQNNLRIRDTARQRESISGTYSGIAEGGRATEAGRIDRSGVSGSAGTGNTTGAMTGSMAASGETTTGAKADRPAGTR